MLISEQENNVFDSKLREFDLRQGSEAMILRQIAKGASDLTDQARTDLDHLLRAQAQLETAVISSKEQARRRYQIEFEMIDALEHDNRNLRLDDNQRSRLQSQLDSSRSNLAMLLDLEFQGIELVHTSANVSIALARDSLVNKIVGSPDSIFTKEFAIAVLKPLVQYALKASSLPPEYADYALIPIEIWISIKQRLERGEQADEYLTYLERYSTSCEAWRVGANRICKWLEIASNIEDLAA